MPQEEFARVHRAKIGLQNGTFSSAGLNDLIIEKQQNIYAQVTLNVLITLTSLRRNIGVKY